MLHSKLPNVGTTIFTRMSALAAECGALNLSQGFPDFDAPQELCNALAEHVHAGHNQYAPMAGVLHLREQLAGQLERYRGVQADPETEITVLPGATEGIFCAIMACINKGDEVIVFDPCYDSYEPSIELAGGHAVHVPLTLPDFRIDWQRVSAAVTRRTRMIIVNSPHNPTGSTLDHQDLVALAELAERHDLIVISDEVYEHLVFDGLQHHSVLQYPALRERSFALYSFGKTFSVTGWKTGYCVAAPQLTTELRKVHQFVCFVAVTPVQLAVADFLAAAPDFPGTLAAFYQAKRDLFCAHLANSRFNWVPSSGTYFQLLEYSAISDSLDEPLAVQWTRQHGIASIPISVFYEQAPPLHYLRFCFAKNDDVLVTAAETLCAI
ncbi:MAG: aminotransferase class I/II-fold pyridoxal phosphate-dependent enzyme [Halioglobus sp.]|nr:aminotransferase class I/II-fold pyridoxal phosphate-dependent enzyme [Halioglobus sp.]